MSMYEEEAKRALSEWASSKYARLEGMTFRITTQEELGVSAIGAPTIVEDFDREEMHLIFGGGDGLYEAVIDEGFEVGTPEQILADSTLDYASMGADFAWDQENQEWIATIPGKNDGDKARAAFFDQDFELQDTQILDVHHTAYLGATVSAVPYGEYGDNYLMLVYDKSDTVYAETVPDKTARPLGTPTDHGAIRNLSNSDGCSVTLWNRNRLVGFTKDTPGYSLGMLMGPPASYGLRDSAVFGDQRLLTSYDPIIAPRAGAMMFDVPRITSLFRTLFLVFRVTKGWGGGTAERSDEVWMKGLPPSLYEPARRSPWRERLPGNTTTGIMPGMGADSLTVHIDAAATGTFELHEHAGRLDILNAGEYVSTTESISSTGHHKFIYNSPMPYFRVKTNFDCDVWVSLQ